MALTQYCALDEVRAALGVNSIELSDTVLNLPVYEIGLVRELAKVSESLPAAFLVAAGKAVEDRSADEQRLTDSVHLFSAYAAARQVGVALAIIAPKDVTDGKAAMSRFSGEAYKDVLARVDTMYAGCRSDVENAYSSLNSSVTASNPLVPSLVFKASRRGYDPVTGS